MVDAARRASPEPRRAAEVDERLDGEATSRAADFKHVADDLEARAADLAAALKTEAARLDGSVDAERAKREAAVDDERAARFSSFSWTAS